MSKLGGVITPGYHAQNAWFTHSSHTNSFMKFGILKHKYQLVIK